MNHRRLPVIVLLCAGLCLTPFAALAQTTAPAPAAQPAAQEPAGEPVKLDVFQVTTSGDVGYLSTNAAEATRMNTPIENIPMNITVFNQQFIEDLMATDSSEVIAFDASSVRRTENDGFLARGTTSVGSTFLNGLPQTAGFGSQPLANIERIEVLRGPAAILFGSGGFGATYNRITKRAGAKQFTRFRGIFSDAASYRLELDHNLGKFPGLGDKLLVRINGVYAEGTTWFGQNKDEKAFAPTLTWNIGPKTSLTLDYIYNFTDNQASWETPMTAGDPLGFTFGDGTYHLAPRKTNWTVPEDFRRNTRTSTAADFRHAFSDNLQFRGQFQYETREQQQQETVSNGTTLIILRDTVLSGRYWRDFPRITRTYRTRDELVWTGRTGPIKHRLLGGFAFDEQYDDNKNYQSAQPSAAVNGTFANVTYAQFLANPMLVNYNPALWLMPVNLFDRSAEAPVPPIAQRVIAPLTGYTRNYTSTTEFYVNDVLSFLNDRVYVMAGMRSSHFKRATQNRRTGSGNTASIATTYPTVRAEAEGQPVSYGVVWHLTADKQYSLYANANTAFNPDFNVNPDGSGRDPNTGNQKEVGLRFNLLSGKIQGTAAYFELVANSNVADPDRLGYTIRQDGAESSGFEFNANTNLTKDWSLMTGFAIIDSFTAGGSKVDLQPKYKLSVLNTYKFSEGKLKGLNLTLAAIYNGERPVTGPFSTAAQRSQGDWGPVPAWWRADVVASYRYKPKNSRLAWDFSVKVGNVFDNQEIYYVAAAHRYTIEQGRNWQASAGIRF
jgi:iron complex outermembrane receptor protein